MHIYEVDSVDGACTIRDVPVDPEFMLNRYNFGLCETEIVQFFINRHFWKEFSNNPESCCLITAGDVTPFYSYEEMKDALDGLPEDWDVFFPFKKNNPSPEAAKTGKKPYLLGFYWGALPYFISPKGVSRLLAIDRLRQPVDEEILMQSAMGNLTVYSNDTKWFDYQENHDHMEHERRRHIKRSILDRSVWSSANKQIARNILAVMSKTATRLNIDLVLHGGSLLGLIRHGEIIPWDDDIDIGIKEADAKRFFEAITDQGLFHYDIFIEPHTRIPYYKLWTTAGETIDGYNYLFPFIDLWPYKEDQRDIVFNNGITFPGALEHPFINRIFEGSVLQIPANYTACLDKMYKDWRSRIRIYPWSHRLEKNANYPLETDIRVDESGRLIPDEAL